MSRPQCLLDMDGVLADFNAGAYEVHRRDGYEAHPEYRGIYTLQHCWGMTDNAFWQPINAYPSFWALLPKLPDADGIVEFVTGVFGEENIAILTAPAWGPHCIPGKQQWIRQHYPQFKRRIIFGSCKEFCAGPERYLLDDRDTNVEKFDEAGGFGILVPRLWNSRWNEADHTLERLKEDLENIGE